MCVCERERDGPREQSLNNTACGVFFGVCAHEAFLFDANAALKTAHGVVLFDFCVGGKRT